MDAYIYIDDNNIAFLQLLLKLSVVKAAELEPENISHIIDHIGLPFNEASCLPGAMLHNSKCTRDVENSCQHNAVCPSLHLAWSDSIGHLY